MAKSVPKKMSKTGIYSTKDEAITARTKAYETHKKALITQTVDGWVLYVGEKR